MGTSQPDRLHVLACYPNQALPAVSLPLLCLCGLQCHTDLLASIGSNGCTKRVNVLVVSMHARHETHVMHYAA